MKYRYEEKFRKNALTQNAPFINSEWSFLRPIFEQVWPENDNILLNILFFVIKCGKREKLQIFDEHNKK